MNYEWLWQVPAMAAGIVALFMIVSYAERMTTTCVMFDGEIVTCPSLD